MPISSLGYVFTVSSVNTEFFTSTFLNVVKRRESVLFKNTVPINAASVAYISGPELSASRNLSIVDKSTFLAANKVVNTDPITRDSIGSFLIETDQFLVTDVFTTSLNSQITTPLFYKHVINTTNLRRQTNGNLASGVTLLKVRMFDALQNEIGPASYSVNYTTGTVYSNLQSEFIASDDYTHYYVQYTVNDNGEVRVYLDLLDNEPIFNLATIDDLDEFMNLDSDADAYLLDDLGSTFKVTLPTIGTYAYKQIEQARVKVLPPINQDITDPWYIRVTNGSFAINLDGLVHRYHVGEFLDQSFFPAPPIHKSTEFSTVLAKHLLKLDRTSILLDEDEEMFLDIQINDTDGTGLAAFTTDPDLDGTQADNLIDYQFWSSASPTGIRSVDRRTGFVELENFDLTEDYEIVSEYYYSETEYEYTVYDFNPVINSQSIQERVIVFVDPEVGGVAKEQTLYYLVLDMTGKVIRSNWSRFNNSTQKLDDDEFVYYDTWPDFLQTTTPGDDDYISPDTHEFLSEFSVEGTNTVNFLVLGEVSVGEATHFKQLLTLDTRVRGGGVREEKFNEAIGRDPDTAYNWDTGHWDGLPYPGNAAYYVEVPVDLLEGAGGVWTSDQIHDVVYKHTALGVYPVIKAYGVDVIISGMNPNVEGIALDWISSGYNDETIYYNIYHAQSEQGPWTTANDDPVLHNNNGNHFTVSGLQLGVVYYIAILGGVLEDDEFLPYAALQSIANQAKGAALIGAGINPQIKFKTFTPKVTALDQFLLLTFTVV